MAYNEYEYPDKLMINTLNKIIKETKINPYIKAKKIIDMHTHTTYSDGDLTPDELIRLAIERKVGTLAITDHDTIEGLKNIDKESSLVKDTGINIINGIELSSKVTKGQLHILGYNIDINNEILNKKLLELKSNSLNSVLSVMEELKRSYNIIFDYEDIKELVNANHNLGRPDLAKLLIKYGYVSTFDEAFQKYLVEAYNKVRGLNKWMPYEECIDLILKSGGIPVLAHPKKLELPKKEFLIFLKKMIACGLRGIEVYHPCHNLEDIEYYTSVAEKFNLLTSAGSDYHGVTVKPDRELGINPKGKKLTLLSEL